MVEKNESLTKTALRSTIKTLFGVVGIALGALLVLMVVGLLSGPGIGALPPVTPKYEVTVLPDAKGKRQVLPRSAPIILQLEIEGFFGSRELNSESFQELLQESREGALKGRSIKGILLEINSPGGSLTDIDTIYRAIRAFSERHEIPVYAHIDGAALSGGYYVAAAADKIFASPTSLVGSIGVIMPPMVNVTKTLEKLGVETLTISSGEGKDLMNPVRPWHDGEQEPLQKMTDYYYGQFVDLIVERRPNLDRRTITEVVKAGFYPSQQALEYGLIDHAEARRRDALAALAEDAGISQQPYQVVGFKRKMNFFENVFQEKSLLHGEVVHRIELIPGLPAELLGQPLALHWPSL